MTTSPEPWMLELKPDGFTYMKDAFGEQIAKFLHGRDAEYLLESLHESTKKQEELEHENDVLESRIGNLQNTIETLEKELEESKTKL